MILGNATANGTLELIANSTTTTNRPITISSTSSNIAVDTNSTLTLGATSSISSGNTSDNLNKTGNGTLVLNKAFTYTSGTNITAGTLEQNVTNALPSASPVTVGASGTFAMNGFDANVDALSGSGNVTMSSLTGNGNLTVTDGSGITSTFTGIISGNTVNGTAPTTDANFVKAGTGTLVLGGNNTFTGQTNITAGTLTVNSSLALQFSDVNYNPGDGNLTFGSGVTAVTMAELLGSKDLVLSNTNGTALGVALTEGGDDDSENDYTGNLSGLGSLIKIGTGDLMLTGNVGFNGALTVNSGSVTLWGNNTYAGGTNIASSATLNLGDFSIVPQLPGSLANNGTVNYNESYTSEGTTTFAGVMTGNGTLNATGASVLVTENTAGKSTNITSSSVSGDILVLTGASSNNGTVFVGGGSGLVVKNTLPAAITIGSGSYLGGNGNIGGPGDDVDVDGGVLAPGFTETMTYSHFGSTTKDIGHAANLDTLTIAGNLVWDPSTSAANIFHLSTTNNASDAIHVLGNVSYSGNNTQVIDFDFEDTGFYAGTPEIYTLLTSSSSLENLGFTLNQLQAQNVYAGGLGEKYGQSYFTWGNGGDALDFVVVPEPSTWGLLAGGMMLLLGWRRKRSLAKAAKAAPDAQA